MFPRRIPRPGHRAATAAAATLSSHHYHDGSRAQHDIDFRSLDQHVSCSDDVKFNAPDKHVVQFDVNEFNVDQHDVHLHLNEHDVEFNLVEYLIDDDAWLAGTLGLGRSVERTVKSHVSKGRRGNRTTSARVQRPVGTSAAHDSARVEALLHR